MMTFKPTRGSRAIQVQRELQDLYEPNQHGLRRNVTWEEVRAIRARYGKPEPTGAHFDRIKSPNGVSAAQLAKEFHRTPAFIRQVVLNQIWKETACAPIRQAVKTKNAG